ncbi:MAG TPA: hypothetical protein VK303_06775, partial [Desulfobacteria bacterium]|nr:hypothetical protein [Desulfobacteria bacterium]
ILILTYAILVYIVTERAKGRVREVLTFRYKNAGEGRSCGGGLLRRGASGLCYSPPGGGPEDIPLVE